MSEILRVLEETRGALQQAINTLYNLPGMLLQLPRIYFIFCLFMLCLIIFNCFSNVIELLALRSKTTVQIAVINTFKSKGTQVENLEELDIVRLFCSIPELNKVHQNSSAHSVFFV